jgi:hypothetical protein
MTALLEKVFAEAKELPDQDQNALAVIIREEILAEKRWDLAFANSQKQLEQLAGEALAEMRRGETKPLKFD